MANNSACYFGIALLIIAGIGFIIPINDRGYSIPQINELCTSGLGQLGQLFSGDLQKVCFGYRYLTYGIYGFGLIGIILLIIGAVVPSRKDEKSLTCPYCNYVATLDSELLKHKADNHLDKSPFKCEHCDFIGITEEILWNHYNDKHQGKKKW